MRLRGGLGCVPASSFLLSGRMGDEADGCVGCAGEGGEGERTGEGEGAGGRTGRLACQVLPHRPPARSPARPLYSCIVAIIPARQSQRVPSPKPVPLTPLDDRKTNAAGEKRVAR